MRALSLVAVPLFAALSVAPATAQVSARIHLDIPIGRQGPAYAAPHRQLVVREYDAARFGSYESYYDQWAPETAYYYNGYYYDYPVVEYAQPVVLYRYRNEIFLPPRGRDFIRWRDTWHGRGDYGGYRARPVPRAEAYRPLPGMDRGGRYDGRNGQAYQRPRDDHRDPSPRNNGNGNGHAPRSAPGHDHGGRARP